MYFVFSRINAGVISGSCSWCVCGIWCSYWWCPVQLRRGQLLLSDEDIMAIILLCYDCSLHTQVHEPVWNRTLSHVLRGIYQSLETVWTFALYPLGCFRGELFQRYLVASSAHAMFCETHTMECQFTFHFTAENIRWMYCWWCFLYLLIFICFRTTSFELIDSRIEAYFHKLFNP